MNDPIIDEIRRIRDEHAAAFNYDIDAIFRDLQERQKASGRAVVSFPPQLIEPKSERVPVSNATPLNEIAEGIQR